MGRFRKILKLNVNYGTNLEILEKIKSYYHSFIEKDNMILSNLIELVQQKESEDVGFKLFAEKLLIILEDLDKTYAELVKKSKNINSYLIDLIKNLKVDSTDYLVDGIRIYSLTDIRLSNYDVLYVVNMNDDVIPGKMNYDFFNNEDNIVFYKTMELIFCLMQIIEDEILTDLLMLLVERIGKFICRIILKAM